MTHQSRRISKVASMIDANQFIQDDLEPQIRLRMRPLDRYHEGITEGLRIAGELLRRFAVREYHHTQTK